MHNIKFWFSRGSCSLATHTLLHEAGLPFTPIETSVLKQETLSPAFSRINPKQRVPVLAYDDAIITETPAIALAISQWVPEKGLLGVSELDKVRALEWMCWLSGEVHGQAFGGLFRPQRFTDEPDQYESLQTKAKQRVAHAFKTIESKIGKSFAIGKSLTIVDPYLLVFFNWGQGIGFDMKAEYPVYTEFSHLIAEHPSVIKALKD
ncbi:MULTISPECIES: glutathione S-transferase family protein [unclassified Pantoea]|jgi:glutathione S-transferase|uniref:glutathione S-transferase family protein n=1 Tax=unclassified Pantoea TaxID=2630326 RepID=UPI001CD2F144|nr:MULTISPECIES: glutathione S-transferase N-terminal domain-containing protein [unclassified Pantoea]MCA1177381.1 glutathione S-transferase N-terminal domain-containing protein [Pantoea sp. alder69]MCA1249713.1 glutathione S-transferase N-terminal domain-containing protein [Pantoea sp. alder70]MCA1265870.1 glutathione S-transferase N-terminal domain-containing protein [Pantoea sp. alder81]